MTISWRWRTLYDFTVFVKTEDWDAAWSGNEEAKRRIADELDGVSIYFHAGPHMGDGYMGVTIPDLLTLGIIPRVTLHKDD